MEDFYNSFGAFASEKSAEEIINEIKESRNFRNKDLELIWNIYLILVRAFSIIPIISSLRLYAKEKVRLRKLGKPIGFWKYNGYPNRELV